MKSIIEVISLAFTIGLTGALAPGPTLVATIDSSLKGGWSAGPKIAAGHALVELAIFLLIIVGLAETTQQFSRYIAWIGGLALIGFGILTIRDCRKATLVDSKKNGCINPYLAGILTSAANPYFWIWWLSIGSALLIEGLSGGLIIACVFMIGHWSADFGWYTFVSANLNRGKAIISEAIYQKLLGLCGGFLMIFGIYYLINV